MNINRLEWFKITCKGCNEDCDVYYDQQNENDSISVFIVCHKCSRTEDILNIKLEDIMRF
jgi:hypothetical protein